MAYIDDLRTKLSYLEESDANKPAADEVRKEIAAEEARLNAEADLTSLRKDELVARARAAGLDSSGTKDELISRLTAEQPQ